MREREGQVTSLRVEVDEFIDERRRGESTEMSEGEIGESRLW